MVGDRVFSPSDFQKILNDVGARRAQERPPRPVRARIVWERDGEEWIEATATRFDPRDGAIFVDLVGEPRSQIQGVFLAQRDLEFLDV